MQTEGRARRPLEDHLHALALLITMGPRALISTKMRAYLLPATTGLRAIRFLAGLTAAIALRVGLTLCAVRSNAMPDTAKTTETARLTTMLVTARAR